jgi:Glyoxalase-like domain
MASRFTELTIDCADPHALARFWCSVLDYEVQDEDDGVETRLTGSKTKRSVACST